MQCQEEMEQDLHPRATGPEWELERVLQEEGRNPEAEGADSVIETGVPMI